MLLGRRKAKNGNGLVIGSWYTQYSAGYWKLIELKPKIADSDYIGENASWKKGDRIGEWAIVKKALTPKMKKSIRVECVDSAHLTAVPLDVAAEIDRFFEEDPKFSEKFKNTANTPEPFITNMWLKLSEDEVAELNEKLSELPERFTMDEFKRLLELDADRAAVNPGAGCTHLMNLLAYPWELTDKFDNIYCGADLKKL